MTDIEQWKQLIADDEALTEWASPEHVMRERAEALPHALVALRDAVARVEVLEKAEDGWHETVRQLSERVNHHNERAEIAERAAANTRTAWEEERERHTATRARLETSVAAHEGRVWFWMDNDEDDPESLACPAVVPAAVIRRMAAAERQRDEARAALQAARLDHAKTVTEANKKIDEAIAERDDALGIASNMRGAWERVGKERDEARRLLARTREEERQLVAAALHRWGNKESMKGDERCLGLHMGASLIEQRAHLPQPEEEPTP